MNRSRKRRLGGGPWRRSWARVASRSEPKRTPEGHAVSHARQPRQRSMWRGGGSVRGRRSPPPAPLPKNRPPRGALSPPPTPAVGHPGRAEAAPGTLPDSPPSGGGGGGDAAQP